MSFLEINEQSAVQSSKNTTFYRKSRYRKILNFALEAMGESLQFHINALIAISQWPRRVFRGQERGRAQV